MPPVTRWVSGNSSSSRLQRLETDFSTKVALGFLFFLVGVCLTGFGDADLALTDLGRGDFAMVSTGLINLT